MVVQGRDRKKAKDQLNAYPGGGRELVGHVRQEPERMNRDEAREYCHTHGMDDDDRVEELLNMLFGEESPEGTDEAEEFSGQPHVSGSMSPVRNVPLMAGGQLRAHDSAISGRDFASIGPADASAQYERERRRFERARNGGRNVQLAQDSRTVVTTQGFYNRFPGARRIGNA